MVPIVKINSIGNYLKYGPETIYSDNNPRNINSKSKRTRHSKASSMNKTASIESYCHGDFRYGSK